MRACLGCGKITDQKRCPKCRRTNRERRKAEGLTGERGSTYAWRKLRAKVIKRDGGRCTVCDTDKQLHVHHIDGDATNDAMTNLVTICRSCHQQLHGGAEKSLARRTSTPGPPSLREKPPSGGV